MPSLTSEEGCPCEEDIAELLRRHVAGHQAGPVEAHVSDCSRCTQLLAVLARAANGSHPATESFSPTLPARSGGEGGELPIGGRLGRYVVLGLLGSGGMGVVYVAHDPKLSRKVALKVLRNDGAGAADRFRDLLLREGQAMAQLAHPNVVTVFDVGTVDDRVFIAMELIEGLTLSRWLSAARRAPREIIATFLAAGNGLAAAHAAGLIHRDFKPDNVLIGNDGRVRVSDFGLARPAPSLPPGTPYSAAATGGRSDDATQTGLAGTLAYMAPEQYHGRVADARADQFSFAVALYEALYGERPSDSTYDVERPRAASGRVVTARCRPGATLAPRDALLRALNPDPDKRYATMTELLAALAPGTRRARARGILAGTIALVAMAVLSAGGYAIHLRHSNQQRTELVGRLRGLAPELRTVLRSAHMLPLHDTRPAREQVRRVLREVERELQTPAGQDERALGYFVLGEGQRALGDHQRALDLLEAAWAAGERGPHMDTALGDALGAVYERQLEQIEQTVQSSQRDKRLRAIEERYRDPALAHLRAALATRNGSTSYLEAVISFHEHRFVEASRSAHVAFASSPTLYEAGVLEARAHNEAARALQEASKPEEARIEFAAARQTFERVLEIARSDDDAWLGYAEMLLAQAVSVAVGSDLPVDLQQRAIAALHNVQQINPENAKAFLEEAHVYLAQGNVEVIWHRDPSPYLDKGLALAEAARAHGAATDDVDSYACVAHWERAAYQGYRGIDPRAALKAALDACTRAADTRPDSDRHGTLGVVYATVGTYEGAHGSDPMHSFHLGEHHLRAAIELDDDAGEHYNLARLWTKVAQYQSGHGEDPERAVGHALADYETTGRRNATRPDVWSGMSDALAVRARFMVDRQLDPEPTLTQARAALERALAIVPDYEPAIRSRIVIAEVEARARLARDADPAPEIERMRGDTRLLLGRNVDDGFAHRARCEAELLAARWAHAHRRPVERLLQQAASEAARATLADATDAAAWTASAEVEQLRVEAARARGSASTERAVTAGLAYADRAVGIDPRLARALQVRDALMRQRVAGIGAPALGDRSPSTAP